MLVNIWLFFENRIVIREGPVVGVNVKNYSQEENRGLERQKRTTSYLWTTWKDVLGLKWNFENEQYELLTDEEKNKTEVHLEIWFGNNSKTSTINPHHWLYKQSF